MLETEGISALLSDIRKMEKMFDISETAPRDEVKNLMVQSADVIEKEMHRRLESPDITPNNLTGKLNAAIHTGKVKRRASKGHYITIGVHRQDWSGGDDYYPAYVEYGHAGPAPAPPHPYIRKSYDEKKDEAYKILRDGLGELISDCIKK